MNIDDIKNKIKNDIGKKVHITVYGMRNKINYYEGPIYKVYPNIFTILENGEEKSFAYRDIITKDINVKYLWFYILKMPIK